MGFIFNNPKEIEMKTIKVSYVQQEKRIIILFGLLLFVLSIALSFQASALEIPSAIQPGQLEKQLTPPLTPKSAPVEKIPVGKKQIPLPEANSAKFYCKNIVFTGATVYQQQFLKSFFSDLVGKLVTPSQVAVATENLTAHYRNDGYILAHAVTADLPAKEGTVTINVNEGFIDAVDIQANQANDMLDLVQKYVEKIRAVKPIRQSELERYLLLLNDLPGVYATGSLSPSQTQPGAATLVINATQKNFGGQLGFNNRLTKLLGTYRGELYAEANNILKLQEKTYARLLQSFEGKMTVLSLGEDIPISNEGTRLSFMLNQVWSNTPLFDIASGLDSRQVSFNLAINHPIIRSRNQNLNLRGSFSLLDSISKNKAFKETISNDRIRSFRIGLTYDLADSWQGINIADIELSQGIDALGARNPSDELRSTGNSKLSAGQGQVDYVKANLYLARLQTISPEWSFLAAFQGQYTEDVLLAPEQFSLGGEQFLRAYDPSEFIGDKGFATKAEMRYTFNPFDKGSMTLYGFYDYGEIHYNSNRPSVSVAATGVGLRVSYTPNFSGYIEGAKPLHPNQSTEQNKDMRVFGGFSLTF
ncbi:hypothetical protein MCAMS1_01029 [biofilm metagenome]